MSSLGAIVIILSLAIDPFAQQLAHPGVKTFAANLEAVANVQWMYSVHSMRATQAMVYLAFFGAKPLETPYVCPSGICSWSPYQTLAVCDECVDISDLVNEDNSCSSPDKNCSVHLMHGSSIEVKMVDPEWQRTRVTGTGKGALQRIDNPGLSIINYTQLTYTRPNYFWASECTLRWCINRYSAKLQSGVFTEIHLDSWWSPADTKVLNIDDKREYYRITPHHRQVRDNSPEEDSSHNAAKFSSASSSSNLSSGVEPCYVESLSHAGFSHALISFLDFSGDNNDTSNADIEGYLADLHHTSFFDGKPPIHSIFSSISAGLTQWLRLDAQARSNQSFYYIDDNDPTGPNITRSRRAAGTAFETRTVIRIRWGWLVFPVGLVAMTAVVTLQILLRSSREDIPVWGSSTLALILRGPFSKAHKTLPGNNSTDQFQRMARQTEVSLEKDVDRSWSMSQKRTTTEQESETSISAFSRAFILGASRGNLGGSRGESI